MSHEFVYMAEGAVEGLLSLFGSGSFLRLVSYVFCALSLYTIAERRGIRNAWLAWVPVVNLWILGSISDQYRYVTRGQIRNKRSVLLSIRILHVLLSCVASVRMIISVVRLVSGGFFGMDPESLFLQILAGFAFYIPVLILSIIGFVFEVMVLYDVYSSCEPANNVLYLILSVIPGISLITKPLFLFLSRDRDGGMPPRREPVMEDPFEF